jgi:sirohydrochlorin cobaltochelatase
MVKRIQFGWLVLAFFLSVVGSPGAAQATSTAKPAIVLAAFGTTTEAFATYNQFEQKVKARFPGYEIRWAFTSRKVRHKMAQEKGQQLKDLPTTLRDLKAAGFTQVAIQSLHIVPGEEWEKKVVEESRKIPGLKVTLGKPLLSTKEDQDRVIQALAQTFPKDLKDTAVVLVGHGSPSPEASATYLAFSRLLRSRYPHQNVFLGTVEGKPTREEALEAVKKSGATTVVLMPFLFVAGEHVANDILGDNPESWKSELLKQKAYRIEGITKGLGYQDGIINIYLDHLAQALQGLQDSLTKTYRLSGGQGRVAGVLRFGLGGC